MKATLLLLAASAVAAPPGQPARPGPRTDLVAAPPQVPFFVPFPRLYAPFWGGGYGFYGGYGYPGFVQPPQVVVVPQPVLVAPPNPARIAEDGDRAAALVSATLTLELPAAADVWLDGQKQATSADATRVLASPPMTIGEQYTFRVRAEWVEKGTKYQTEQTTTVRAGERGKLTVYAGTAVK